MNFKDIFAKNFTAKFYAPCAKNSSPKKGQIFGTKSLNLSTLQVVKFDKIFYVWLENLAFKDENLEEVLFERACDELGIKERFDYGMSYVLDDDKALVFLTLDENLDFKGDFAIAEPLLWRSLHRAQNLAKAQIPPFYAVLVLQKSYGYVAFFGDDRLLGLKNLPLFSFDYLSRKDETARQDFLNERVIEPLRALCHAHRAQMLVLVGDELALGEFVSAKLELSSFCLDKFAAKAHFKLNEWAEFLQIKAQNKASNFLRHKLKESSPNKLISGFVACFVLGFCFVGAEFLLKRQALKNSFELDTQLPKISDLQKESKAYAQQIRQNKEILAYMSQELTPTPLLDTMKALFALLYESQITLQSLEFSANEIKILIPHSQTSENFIKNLYANALFTLKNKELAGDFYELVLERK